MTPMILLVIASLLAAAFLAYLYGRERSALSAFRTRLTDAEGEVVRLRPFETQVVDLRARLDERERELTEIRGEKQTWQEEARDVDSIKTSLTTVAKRVEDATKHSLKAADGAGRM